MDGESVNLISSAIANVGTLYTTAVSMVTENLIPLTFIGMSLIGRALGLFKHTIHIR